MKKIRRFDVNFMFFDLIWLIWGNTIFQWIVYFDRYSEISKFVLKTFVRMGSQKILVLFR